MTDHPTPDEIRQTSFRVAFRGFDQEEVSAHLEALASLVDELTAERDRLAARLGEFADRDLQSEFETVGREVSAVLESARTAAEAMRERASADAARWRAEAMVEVDSLRKEARADAEALRSDAWTTGSQLLEQVLAEVEQRRQELERDVLAMRGEAERDAHRLTSAARREAEDALRSSSMEAERITTQARSDHDDIIAAAHRAAEVAQERARALEARRGDLMEELETVRAALTAVEGDLEERRHGIGLSEPPELPREMVIVDEEGAHVESWEEGRTVRVIRPDKEERSHSAPAPEVALDDAERLADEVAGMRRGESQEPASELPVEEIDDEPDELADVDEASEVEGAFEDDETEEPLPEPEEPDQSRELVPEAETLDEAPEGEEPEADEPEADEPESDEPASESSSDQERSPFSNGTGDDLSDLFRRLRQPTDADPEEGVSEAEGEPEDTAAEPVTVAPERPPEEPSALPEGVDPFETRERLLLPITNSTLRTVKRALTEAQNEALEQLRVSEGGWEPDPDRLDSAIREELEALADQASQAGLEAAMEMGMTGVRAPEATLPPAGVGDDLADAIRSALASVGNGARERQAAASRVFRGWRTDEAERRIRSYALGAYHHALREALDQQSRPWRWQASGRLCPLCREASDRGDVVPPAHRDCACTIVPF